MDEILAGGFPGGRTTLISGGPGSGKTTLACTFARAACDRGEKVLYISFAESGPAVVSSMLSPGIDPRPAVKAGRMEFLTVMPEAMGAEQHLARALRQITAFVPDHLIIDAISATLRMGDEHN